MPVLPDRQTERRKQEVLQELLNQQVETLALYEPLACQEEYHCCLASEILITGGNRSGKSVAGWIEDARALCGCDPHGKYPEKDGTLVIVAQNWKQIGMVVFPALFKPGLFKIIKDLQTGRWRAYRPWSESDGRRKNEAVPSRPLIPKRLLKPGSMSFLNRKEKHLSSFEMLNGWKCNICSADGEVPMGFPANRIHFDEDVDNPAWMDEMQARLSDRAGVLHWTATPTRGNDIMLDLSERAEKQLNDRRKNPDVMWFRFSFLDNPHIADKEKAKRLEGWEAAGKDVVARRVYGEFTVSGRKMYPSFDMGVHGYQQKDLPDGRVPADWTRYAFIDPGHQVCAVLFVAVPPETFHPGKATFVLLYDELYLEECNAEIFGQRMAQKCLGQSFHAFVLDYHGGRLRDIGAGRSVKQQYTDALRKNGVEAVATGHGFIDACDDVEARTEAVRRGLHIRNDGTPKIRVLEDSCQALQFELKRYRKKIDPKTKLPTDQPETRGMVHQCQNLEYMAAYDPKYHKPRVVNRIAGHLRDYLRTKRARRGDNAAPHSVALAPGG